MAVADLAGLLWGGGFLSLTLYMLAAAAWLRFRIRRRIGSGEITRRLDLNPAELAVDDRGRLYLNCFLPVPVPPGFRVSFRVELRGRDTVRRSEFPLFRKRTSVEGTVSLRSRGRYRATSELVLSDFLGFTGCLLLLPGEEELVVVPRPIETRTLPLPSSPAHESSDIVPRPQEDGLDVRQYFPGDDPRRISWKLYAHTGKLFLRTGSEARRPVGSALCILDVSCATREPSEALIGLFAGGVFQLASRGVECLVMLPGGCFPVGSDEESRRKLLRELADVGSETGPAPGRLPGEGPVYLFSSHRAPGQEALIRKATEDQREVYLLLHEELQPAAPAPRKIHWLRLVLRDLPGKPAGDANADADGGSPAAVRMSPASVSVSTGPDGSAGITGPGGPAGYVGPEILPHGRVHVHPL